MFIIVETILNATKQQGTMDPEKEKQFSSSNFESHINAS